MNTAFMEGVHAAKKGKSIKDNPYCDEKMLCMADKDRANLWAVGLLFQLEHENVRQVA